MRWDPGHDSPDLIDRRGERPASGGGGLGTILFLLPWLIRSPWGWLVLLVVGGVSLYGALRGGPSGDTTGATEPQGSSAGARASEPPVVHFVSFVLDDTQATWTSVLAARGVAYRHAKLVLFTDSTATACGYGQAATGPFYCQSDERVYLDVGFFQELEQRLGARGDFAKAYVVAHEIGHHVQKVLGTTDRLPRSHLQGATGASVRVELQADCYAGIWAHSTQERQVLENGDVESALGAAASIGDDRLQRQETGTVSPERWTHGSSDERVRWFRRGYDSGKIDDCDTFAATSL